MTNHFSLKLLQTDRHYSLYSLQADKDKFIRLQYWTDDAFILVRKGKIRLSMDGESLELGEFGHQLIHRLIPYAISVVETFEAILIVSSSAMCIEQDQMRLANHNDAI